MPILSSCYELGEGLLKTTYHIDGLFIELESLESIKDRISYLRLPHVNHVSIKTHFQHVQKACGNGWTQANRTPSMEQHIRPLYCTDHRWLFFLNLSVVPQYNQSRTKIACTDFTARYQAVNFINKVRACFTMELRDLDMEDVSRDSVQKNSLSDPSNFNVLAQDQQFVLKVLDKAITKGNIGPEL